jgi:6-phosphogluconolactonase (cycloisomerase 2 family)
MMLTRRFFVLPALFLFLLTFAGCKGFFSARDNSSPDSGTGVLPKFAYVVTNTVDGNSALYAFTVNSSTGALAQAGSATAVLGTANTITTDPTGKYVYVGGGQSSLGVTGYQISRTDGTLTAMSSLGFGSSTNPLGIVVHPSGKFVFTANNATGQVSVYQLGANGVLSEGMNSPVNAAANPLSLAVDDSGRFLYVANDTTGTIVFTVSQTDGTLKWTSTVAPNEARSDAVAITPNSKFAYVANFASPGGIDAYAVNASNGDLTLIAGSPFSSAGNLPSALVVEPTGKYLYAVNQGSSNLAAFTINADGSLTQIGTAVSTGTAPIAVTADPSGKFIYVANATGASVSIYSILSNGGLNLTGTLTTADKAVVGVAVTP